MSHYPRDTHQPPLQILPLTPGMLDQILAIEAVSFPDPWSRALFEAELGHDWSHQFVCAQVGQVRAYTIFWLVLDEVHILNLATHPQHLGAGHATRLLRHTIQFAIEHKARYITLEVRRSNHPAIALYRKTGFVQESIRPRYYADNQEDALIMTLYLDDTAA